MVCEAVNVKGLPAQLGLLPVVKEIETVGVAFVVLVNVIEFEVAVAKVTQEPLEVNTQLTTSEFAKELEVKVAVFVPTFTLFTFH